MKARHLVAGLALVSLGYFALRCSAPGLPADGTALTNGSPLVLAHRGGRGLWPESTLHAFRSALALGVDVLEMDVRRSVDGVFVVFHDARLERTTNGQGAVDAQRFSELARLDAGYRFSLDDGESHPFRGRGLHIPALSAVLEAFPKAPLSIEIKDPDDEDARALCALVADESAGPDRLMVSSFSARAVSVFRRHCPHVKTGGTPGETLRFVVASAFGLAHRVSPPAAAYFVPARLGPFSPATRSLVADAAAQGVPIYVWGEGDDFVREAARAGVRGITSDRPDCILATLGRAFEREAIGLAGDQLRPCSEGRSSGRADLGPRR